MVAGGLLLGTIGVFVQEAGQDPLTTVWFRCAFGSAALLAWCVATRATAQLRLRGSVWWLAWASGCLMVLNWALFFAAIERTSIGVATVVFHIQPLLVMALGAWWLREKVSPWQWLMGLLALAGLALATGLFDALQLPTSVSDDYAMGLLLCLGGSLSYALVTLIAKTAKSITPFALAWWQCTMGTVLLSWWPVVHGLPALSAQWAWLAGLGILHTGLAYVVMYTAMAKLPAARIASLQFVYPAAAIVVDWAVYGRTLSPVQLVGVGLMAVAICAVRGAR
jgi:drug/metabolite transporter (DMT)-like permease